MTATQLGFFRKAQGQELVLDHNQIWRDKAMDYIKGLDIGIELDAETVRGAVGDPPHPNCLGALMTSARKAGLIVKVGYRVCSRPERHAAEIRVFARCA